MLVYEDDVLDMKKDNPTRKIIIPEEGLVLQPNQLYLGRTVERTSTETLVPMLEGRSSIGRLGMAIHVTAGFGDVGFNGFWTLEIKCIKPIRIYPFVEVGQVYFLEAKGEIEKYGKSGKYQQLTTEVASLKAECFLLLPSYLQVCENRATSILGF